MGPINSLGKTSETDPFGEELHCSRIACADPSRSIDSFRVSENYALDVPERGVAVKDGRDEGGGPRRAATLPQRP